MNVWSFLIAVVGVLTSAAIITKVIRRPEPGIEGVLLRGGNFKLNKHSCIPVEKRDGVDNAMLYRNHFRFVAWPLYEFRPVSVTDRTYEISIPFDFLVRGVRKNFMITLRPTWGVKPSDPNGINYAARAEKNGRNDIESLTKAVFIRAFNVLKRTPGVAISDLDDTHYLFENIKHLVEVADEKELTHSPNHFPLSHYGCELRGLASYLTRSPMQVYNDDGRPESDNIVVIAAGEEDISIK